MSLVQSTPSVAQPVSQVEGIIENAVNLRTDLQSTNMLLEEYKANLKSLQQANTELQTYSQQVTQERDAFQAEIASLQAQLAEYEQQLEQSRRYGAELEQVITEFQQQQSDLQAQMQSIIAEGEELRSKIQAINQMAANQDKLRVGEIEELRTVQADLLRQLTSLQQQYDNLLKESQVVENAGQECQAQLQASVQQFQELSALKSSAEEELNQLRGRYADLERQLQEAATALNTCIFDKDQCGVNVQRLEQESAVLVAENQAQRQRIAEIEKALITMLDKLR